MSLEEGLKYLRLKDYARAVELLEEYCQQSANFHSPLYIQAKMALARAYRGNNQRPQAIALALELENHLDQEVSQWAKRLLTIFSAEQKTIGIATNGVKFRSLPKAARAARVSVRLSRTIPENRLIFAKLLTITAFYAILFGLFFVITRLLLIPAGRGVIIALLLTGFLGGLILCIAPNLIDWTQKRLYRVRWVSLAEIKRYSPESAAVIGRICREKGLKPPKLGIIEDGQPLAFTYGSRRGNARLVVSRGLFTYLDDEEVATVYAHELGHIWQGDFALMTICASFDHLSCYLDSFAQNQGNNFKDTVFLALLSSIITIFRPIIVFCCLYLSRTREYFADHFAAQVTGNPNALARALVKIAFGLVQETAQFSPLSFSTKVLNIALEQDAIIAGNVYGIALESRRIGQSFLWDIYNPWAKWLELQSNHPLTGERIRALTNYARQMDLDIEFSLGKLLRQEMELDSKKLYQNFFLRLCLYYASGLGFIIGVVIADFLWLKFSSWGALGLILVGGGLGIIINRLASYPRLNNASFSDIFSLTDNPYSHPLPAIPVRLRGELIAQGKNFFLKDSTGIIPLAPNYRFGFWHKIRTTNSPTAAINNTSVQVLGWFRRDLFPRLEWSQITHSAGNIRFYPRFWPLVSGFGLLVSGLIIAVTF
ncbi:MAG: M48 family metalloprotease [Microcystis sp. M114S2]|uniref:M48 family metalloprotease n=1 Tax=unclassified Microcystis TaxID=2643300 RepID=UPI002588620B|nr:MULTISPECIES: M48 family metalloprotease [unclassified Microcystis]MCA2668299.1 M48 family metalloprotease [Microcystis sp. M045S2]MCA2714893.1 M48 family metalloprotease [Microcystis sp. M172S2]MCA2804791.1 M48 family metalloprotease [Microcystis sp. M114S2]MCA2833598.1 M48 family metalloprotease [Microcystis sp. M007S1]MCA2840051.1 M48 family metalloprotease [Microcystis sp. M078S1]